MDSEALISAARAGDARSFEALVAPHRAQLVAHCYRLVGAPADAEDVVQEALVRAWRGLAHFDGRASLRTWLHRIATNACLSALERRPARVTVDALGPAGTPDTPSGAPLEDVAWLEPCPPEWWATAPGPEARYSAKQGVTLAFLTLLQSLPPAQRAVVVFRDVMGWSAAETAEALETSVAAVNSSLQRARAALEAWREAPGDLDETRTRDLLARYVRAWQTGDPDALAALLREDARLTMPPLALWLSGRRDVAAFLQALIARAGELRFRTLEASGSPALATWVRTPAGTFAPLAVQVLGLGPGGLVARLDAFVDPRVFARLGLPLELPATEPA